MEKSNKIAEFIRNLPGKTVWVGIGTPFFQIQGAILAVEETDINFEEKRIGIIPRNQEPWVLQPYTEVTLLTEDRLFVKHKDQCVWRIEVRENNRQF